MWFPVEGNCFVRSTFLFYFDFVDTILNMLVVGFNSYCQFNFKIQIIVFATDEIIIKYSHILIAIVWLCSSFDIYINRLILITYSMSNDIIKMLNWVCWLPIFGSCIDCLFVAFIFDNVDINTKIVIKYLVGFSFSLQSFPKIWIILSY